MLVTRWLGDWVKDWNFGRKMGQSRGWHQGPELRTFIRFSKFLCQDGVRQKLTFYSKVLEQCLSTGQGRAVDQKVLKC